MKQSRLIPCTIVFLIALQTAHGQKRLFYYGVNTRPVEDAGKAELLKIVKKKSDARYTVKTEKRINDEWRFASKDRIRVQEEGQLRIIRKTDKFFPDKIIREMEQTGTDTWYFREVMQNQTIRTGTTSRFLPLHLEDTVTEYYLNGRVRSVSVFEDNQLQTNRNWLSDGSPYIDSLFYSADREPEYEMGDEFFRKYLLSSLSTSDFDLSQINDEVVIGWVIMEDGSMQGVIAREGRIRKLNQFLVNTIAALPGSWQPAMLDGEIVRFYMSIPLNFVHDHVSFQEVELSGGFLHYQSY